MAYLSPMLFWLIHTCKQFLSALNSPRPDYVIFKHKKLIKEFA